MKKNCPICGKELQPKNESGVTKYYCDCTGQLRTVIEILPDDSKGVRQNGSAN
jgi:hypothetical protein